MANNINLILKAIIALSIIGFETNTFAVTTSPKNSLTTATLTTSDIANKAQYSASSVSMGISGGGGSMMGMGGYADDKGDASSTTKSAISKSNINITNEDKQKALTGKDAKDTVASINTDTKNAHTKLEKIFNKDEVEGKVQASAEIIKTFSSVAPKAIGDYSTSKVNELKAQAKDEPNEARKQELLAEAAKWDEGGTYRVALHTVVGGLGGGVAGAAGAGVSAKTIPEIGKAIDEMNLPKEVKTALVAISGTVVGAAAGAATGGGTNGAITGGNAGFTQTVNNYLNTVKMKDGTYKVVGGKVNKNKNIYVVKSETDQTRTGEVLGEMLFENSFYSEERQKWYGILDPSSKEGVNFLNNKIYSNTPTNFEYAMNWRDYNFKSFGNQPGMSTDQTVDNGYRGSQIYQGVYASARDFGNVGAGYVAGYNGLNLKESLRIFRAFQSYQDIKKGNITTGKESSQTVAGENYGWQLGHDAYLKLLESRKPRLMNAE